MRQPRRLWEAHVLAQQTGRTPSEVYYIDDELVAYCFNRAVLTFGNALERALQEASKTAKKQKEADRKVDRVLRRWLSSADPQAAKGRYADPALLMSRDT